MLWLHHAQYDRARDGSARSGGRQRVGAAGDAAVRDGRDGGRAGRRLGQRHGRALRGPHCRLRLRRVRDVQGVTVSRGERNERRRNSGSAESACCEDVACTRPELNRRSGGQEIHS